MKSKFTILLSGALFFAVATQAQSGRYEDRRDNMYGNNDRRFNKDNGFDNRFHDDRDADFYSYRNRLAKEFAEYDRARACGDFSKMRHEKREIKSILREIHHNRKFRHFDDDDFYNGHSRF